MKKRGKFYRNPAPFALAAVNPAKKKKRSLRRRKKNPAVSGTEDRKAGAKRWHHKKGRFLYNPARKLATRKRRKNPLAVKHVIVETPAKNPARKFTKKRRKKNPSFKIIPMSKHRKRRSKRTRNPARKTSRRRSSRRRNPARRRIRRMRNPVAILSDIATKENLTTGAGALVGVVGTRWLVNTLLQGDPTTGQRMFDLPGVTYSTATAPLSQAQFTAKNKIALGFYEVAIPAILGYFMRNQNAAFSRGLLTSSVVNAGIALVRGTDMGNRAGLGAFLPKQAGLRTYIPGVPPMLSGPSTAFIANGSPMRGGMGAAVDSRWMAQTTAGGVDPFRAN